MTLPALLISISSGIALPASFVAVAYSILVKCGHDSSRAEAAGAAFDGLRTIR